MSPIRWCAPWGSVSLKQFIGCYRCKKVDINGAVAAAIEFARNSLGAQRTVDICLEEIESSSLDGIEVWLITLSAAFVPPGSIAAMLAGVGATLGADATREYKIFTVSKSNGEVLSMKIRLLAVPAMT